MHPALRLKSLTTPSPAFRKRAKSLLKGGEAYTTYPERLDDSDSTLISLLPVFYDNLDLTGIPSPDTIHATYGAGTHLDAVVAAAFSLRAISEVHKLPPGTYFEIWPRAWFWMEWLHTHHEHLLRLPKKDLYATCAEIFVEFQAAGYSQLVASTPGVRVVLATTWNLFLDNPEGDECRNVFFFLSKDQMDPDFTIDDYAEGAGGIESLASMVVKNLHHAAVVGKMSSAGCLCLLGKHSTQSPGRIWISEVLQAGLLRALVLVATTLTGDAELDEQLELFLTTALPGYMASLLDVEELAKSETFVASKSLASWQRFHDLVHERLDFLALFDSAPLVLYKACDNMECGQIRVKSELQRCAACLDLYYCSRQCQISDWRAGHRTDCEWFAGLRRLPEERQCSKLDRSFMRALISRDYLVHRPEIFAQQISQLALNYMKGRVVVDVSPWPGSLQENLPFDWFARYRTHGVRSAQSAGRLVVHMMAIPNGKKCNWKILPLRLPGPETRNWLNAIAQKVRDIPPTDPSFDSIVAAELKPLLDMDVQFIHE
ncbi:hypothetical protein DFH09DRAFT_1458653 [Mycena vulgaris]|nr:hypothetical protein DFH09DRAFT_1458653 [Mycena vulgaris]